MKNNDKEDLIQIRLLTPYGKFDNIKGMQNITYEDAMNMRKNMKRFFFFKKKIAIYIGHIDEILKRISEDWILGYVTDIIPYKDGIACVLEFKDYDSMMIANEIGHMSPRWDARKEEVLEFDGENTIKKEYLRPLNLISIGFVESPQIEESGRRLEAQNNEGTGCSLDKLKDMAKAS